MFVVGRPEYRKSSVVRLSRAPPASKIVCSRALVALKIVYSRALVVLKIVCITGSLGEKPYTVGRPMH